MNIEGEKGMGRELERRCLDEAFRKLYYPRKILTVCRSLKTIDALRSELLNKYSTTDLERLTGTELKDLYRVVMIWQEKIQTSIAVDSSENVVHLRQQQQ